MKVMVIIIMTHWNVYNYPDIGVGTSVIGAPYQNKAECEKELMVHMLTSSKAEKINDGSQGPTLVFREYLPDGKLHKQLHCMTVLY